MGFSHRLFFCAPEPKMRYDNAWDFPSRRVYKDREGVMAAEIRLEELMEQYSGMLEYIARGILREDEAVEDCLSRVWLRAVELTTTTRRAARCPPGSRCSAEARP